jgi:hypothetical protein
MTEAKGLIIEANGRELNTRENKVLKLLENKVPETQIIKLKSLWQRNKEVPKPITWWSVIALYAYMLVAIFFLAINLYYQGQVGGAVDYAKYSITLNWLVLISVCIDAVVFFLIGIITIARLVKENPKEKFLNLTDVESLRGPNVAHRLVFNVLILVFMVLYIFSGFWNIITAIVLVFAAAFARHARKEAVQRTLEDINTL